MDLRSLLDTGKLRYGVSTAEKERLARQGTLPGAPEDQSAEQSDADRFAAGFLFGLQYPQMAGTIQPIIDRLKTSDLPFLGGSTPEEQSYASQGVRRGAMEGARGTSLADLIR